LLYHAKQATVAPGIEANLALVSFGEVKARFAVVDVFFDVADRVGQAHRLGAVHAQHVIRQPLGTLSPDAGELSEFVYQSRYRFGEQGHG